MKLQTNKLLLNTAKKVPVPIDLWISFRWTVDTDPIVEYAPRTRKTIDMILEKEKKTITLAV